MHYRDFPITPTQCAANGALDIFVEGYQRNNVAQMLVGLSVLKSASVEQVHLAIDFVQPSRKVTGAEIEAMLAA